MKKTNIAYYDSLKVIPKIEGLDGIDNYGCLSYNKKETIDIMVEYINRFIEDDDKCTKDNFTDRYYFEYEIFIIPSEHYEFENNEELQNYCKKMLPDINKDNLYDFLLSISNMAWESYDHNGNLMYGTICIDELYIDPEIYMSENDRGCTADVFNEGDIVVRKNYPDDLYKVVYMYDSNLLHPELPIRYMGTVFIQPINDNDEESIIRYARSELIKIK